MDQKNAYTFSRELQQLTHYNPDYFYGYTSLLLRAAEIYDKSRSIRPRPKVIFSTAEMLTESQRDYISSIFDCPVYQEYGCSEVDIIAFECPYKRFHVNGHRLFTEFITTDQSYNEIVITDLDNICTPIVRYKIGDSIEKTNDQCVCGRPLPSIIKISGRTNQRIVNLPNGGFFHAVKFAHIIENLFKNKIYINKYRIEHISPKKLLIKLSPNDIKNNKYIEYYIKLKIDEITESQMDSQILFCDIDNDVKNSYYVKLFD